MLKFVELNAWGLAKYSNVHIAGPLCAVIAKCKQDVLYANSKDDSVIKILFSITNALSNELLDNSMPQFPQWSKITANYL